jgi:hypothetical protein
MVTKEYFGPKMCLLNTVVSQNYRDKLLTASVLKKISNVRQELTKKEV